MGDSSIEIRWCPCCNGAGAIAVGVGATPCDECDGTGRRYRATWTTDDGTTCSMAGSGAQGPDANFRAVWEIMARELARAEA